MRLVLANPVFDVWRRSDKNWAAVPQKKAGSFIFLI